MKLKKLVIITLFITSLSNPSLSFGQISPKSFRIAITGNNLDYLPKYDHLGFAVGVDFIDKYGKHFRKTLGTELSFYRIKEIEQSVMLDATYSLGYVFRLGFEIKFLADLGYKFSAFTGDVYKFSNGQYEKTDKIVGQSQVNLKLGFGIEYPLSNKFSILANAKMNHYFPPLVNELFLFRNQEINLGIKYNFNKTNK